MSRRRERKAPFLAAPTPTGECGFEFNTSGQKEPKLNDPEGPAPLLLLGHFHCKVWRRQQHPSTQLRSQPAGPCRSLDWVTALKCSNNVGEIETGGVFIVATRRQSGNTKSEVRWGGREGRGDGKEKWGSTSVRRRLGQIAGDSAGPAFA